MNNFIDSITDYFYTDWAAMTFHDWLGLFVTIIVFIAMVSVYYYVFNPANKEELESRRFIPLDEDKINLEESHER